jgi:hypothetical protein
VARERVTDGAPSTAQQHRVEVQVFETNWPSMNAGA